MVENHLTERQKLDLQKAIEYEKNSTNPKFHRTELEEELAFNFSYQYKDEIERLENLIVSEANKIKHLKDTTEKIRQCQKAIKTFEAMRTFCYSKGDAGKLYFDDMWEHCHNSKSECFSFIQPIKNILNDLIASK